MFPSYFKERERERERTRENEREELDCCDSLMLCDDFTNLNELVVGV
jgi:hypothetical protein